MWAANPGRSRLSSRLSRLKGGCGHDCPPHKAMMPTYSHSPAFTSFFTLRRIKSRFSALTWLM